MKITTVDNGEHWFAVHGGFVEVSGDSVIILSDVAEAAESDRRRTCPRVPATGPSPSCAPTRTTTRLKAALQRAEVRLEVAAK